ncbi:uncharacterized protein Triagg1_611 [Trichoderma aggressivum f. europaeum]|uniref:Uncharacterized protein n=1 Tax=Trichoderma aggressivum f. europaeum TaxID=173218 RepID=A0AAE1ILM6_9HYPO|nr:hypothetical protein Triagg1_611 [Trichoderma aggressivum f. europaeum]
MIVDASTRPIHAASEYLDGLTIPPDIAPAIKAIHLKGFLNQSVSVLHPQMPTPQSRSCPNRRARLRVMDIWNQKALWLPLDEAPPLSVKLLRHHRARDEGSRRSGASQRVEHSEWTQNHKLWANSGARYDLHASICEYTPVQGKERALAASGARALAQNFGVSGGRDGKQVQARVIASSEATVEAPVVSSKLGSHLAMDDGLRLSRGDEFHDMSRLSIT